MPDGSVRLLLTSPPYDNARTYEGTNGRQGAPGEYRGRFRKDHEPLFVFVRDGAPHVCEKDRIIGRTVRAPSKTATVRLPDGKMRGQTSKDPEALLRAHRGSLWWYGGTGHGHDPSADTGHPATFAEAFALDAVTVWSNPGDLVCDPYAGSATVGRACIDTGRRFVGTERMVKYHAIGVERLRQTSIFDRVAT